ncbi:hypothetical protein [Rhodohalobacter sp. 8-1]|uniref:hypothetical protein n=1 Tax=Rhodohalobacter sp. 8-1 TaxID=3131972 RepID=UPI0030EE2419
MDYTSIHPNLFLIKTWHGIVGVLGTLIVAVHLVAFWNGDLPDMWFFYLPAGLYMMIQGFGLSFDYFKIRYPSVVVSQNRVKTEGTFQPKKIDFEKVKRINLNRGEIRAEYKSTGNTDYIRIPFVLRRKDKLNELGYALRSRCKDSDVEFSTVIE